MFHPEALPSLVYINTLGRCFFPLVSVFYTLLYTVSVDRKRPGALKRLWYGPDEHHSKRVRAENLKTTRPKGLK